MADELTLMAVHAHPDDEASSTGGVLATYSGQGIRTVVVTCTNGEFGDAPGGVKPGEDGHDAQTVAQLRLAELREAAKILGVSDLEMLGYHDSGMPDWDYKDRPEAFCNIPLEKVTGRVGALIERYRPQVVVSYDPEGPYQHPDHVHAARAAAAAVAGHRHPGQVLPHRDARQRLAEDMGGAAGTRARTCRHRAMSPPEMRAQMAEAEARITTTIDIRPVLGPQAGCVVHAFQPDLRTPGSAKFPADIAEATFGRESFIRASDSTGAPLPEDDLFAGLRSPAG